MPEVLGVFACLALGALLWFLTEQWTRWRLRVAVPELALLSADQRRVMQMVLNRKEQAQMAEPMAWRARLLANAVKALVLLSFPALLGLLYPILQKSAVPMWVFVILFAMVLWPIFRLATFPFQRAALRDTSRRQLIRFGILVCPYCGHGSCDDKPSSCPRCGGAIDWAELGAGSEARAVAEVSTVAEAQTHRSARAQMWLLMGSLLLVLVLPMPFVTQLLRQTGQQHRAAWRQVDVPSESLVDTQDEGAYNFFLRSDSDAEVLFGPGAEIDPAGVRIQLVDAATGLPLQVEPPRQLRRDVEWFVEETPVRLVARAGVPPGGQIRMVVHGDPAAGPLYFRPQMLKTHLKVIAAAGAPLVGAAAIFGGFVVYARVRRHRAAALGQ